MLVLFVEVTYEELLAISTRVVAHNRVTVLVDGAHSPIFRQQIFGSTLYVLIFHPLHLELGFRVGD